MEILHRLRALPIQHPQRPCGSDRAHKRRSGGYPGTGVADQHRGGQSTISTVAGEILAFGIEFLDGAVLISATSAPRKWVVRMNDPLRVSGAFRPLGVLPNVSGGCSDDRGGNGFRSDVYTVGFPIGTHQIRQSHGVKLLRHGFLRLPQLALEQSRLLGGRAAGWNWQPCPAPSVAVRGWDCRARRQRWRVPGFEPFIHDRSDS